MVKHENRFAGRNGFSLGQNLIKPVQPGLSEILQGAGHSLRGDNYKVVAFDNSGVIGILNGSACYLLVIVNETLPVFVVVALAGISEIMVAGRENQVLWVG